MLLFVGESEPPMRARIVRIEFQSCFALLDCFVVPPGLVQNESQECRGLRRQWVQFSGSFRLCNSRVISPRPCQKSGVAIVRNGVAWIEGKSILVLCLRRVPIPVVSLF